MPTINLLYKDKYPITDKIAVRIPTVGEILDYEDDYYNIVTILTAMPIDLITQLDDMGIDFTTISEFDLFLLLFRGLQIKDTSLIFGGLDLSKFQLGINESTGEISLVDRENDIVIDKRIHAQIANTLRKIHQIEQNRKKPGNEEAKQYMIERARIKAKRRRNISTMSQLESLIIAMVNTEQFKYNYNSVKELTIYQFNESVKQVIKKIDYDNKMFGVYSGNVKVSDLNPDDLNWITHK